MFRRIITAIAITMCLTLSGDTPQQPHPSTQPPTTVHKKP
jgi:hypothetical protein